MRLLGVDLGEARTGFALSDPGGTLASPAGVVAEKDEARLLRAVADRAGQHGVAAIVVGYPRNMDGSAGARAQKCAAFAEKLSEITGLPIHLWDERLSTKSAIGYMNATNTRGKKRKAQIDMAAATIILQSYLDAQRLADTPLEKG